MADGLFLESGYFFVMPTVDLHPLLELFRAHVLTMLKKEGLIDDTFIKIIMAWQHVSDFNVHYQVRIKPNDEKGWRMNLSLLCLPQGSYIDTTDALSIAVCHGQPVQRGSVEMIKVNRF